VNPPPEDPTRPIPAPAQDNLGSPRTSLTTTNPVRELEAKLEFALKEYDGIKKLLGRSIVSAEEAELMRGKVLIIAAQLEGLEDASTDEIERLKVELRRKYAERMRAEAQRDVAQTTTARNKRLNQRKTGMVAEEDLAKAEAELRVAEAQIAIAEVGIDEVKLRIQQFERRRDRIRQAVGLADRAKAPAARAKN
jgi:multidrug resistance efflux pump